MVFGMNGAHGTSVQLPVVGPCRIEHVTVSVPSITEPTVQGQLRSHRIAILTPVQVCKHIHVFRKSSQYILNTDEKFDRAFITTQHGSFHVFVIHVPSVDTLQKIYVKLKLSLGLF